MICIDVSLCVCIVVLQDLLLSGNKLGGSLPTELGLVQRMKSLQIEDTDIVGTLPSGMNSKRSNLQNNDTPVCIVSKQLVFILLLPELGSLPELMKVNLAQNRLSGSIPSWFGNAKALQDLSLHYNGLKGSLPPELGGLKNLTVLSLGGNNLGGTIPPQLSEST